MDGWRERWREGEREGEREGGMEVGKGGGKSERWSEGRARVEGAVHNTAATRGTGPQYTFLLTQIPFLPWSLNQRLHSNYV